MSRVGILGGGQLGMMLAESLKARHAEVFVYEPGADPPAGRFANVVQGKFDDSPALEHFGQTVDVITYEFENVVLPEDLSLSFYSKLKPSLKVLQICQDRWHEKTFLREMNFPHVPFVSVDFAHITANQLENSLGFPCVIKSRRGGYDGHLQMSVESSDDFANAKKTLPNDQRYVAERKLTLTQELSCIVARASDGQSITFPVFENVHRDHILDYTLVPARLDEQVSKKVRNIAKRVASELQLVGLLTVEFFLTQASTNSADGEPTIFINELAPRPHNSGHVTMKACTLSQFDVLADILLGKPLIEPTLVDDQVYGMGNLLGDLWLRTASADGSNANDDKPLEVYLYGKKEARARRKMGHVVMCAQNHRAVIESLEHFRAKFRP